MKVTHTVISYAKQTIQSFRMKANHSHLVCDNCKYILEDKAHVISSCPLYNDFRKKKCVFDEATHINSYFMSFDDKQTLAVFFFFLQIII